MRTNTNQTTMRYLREWLEKKSKAVINSMRHYSQILKNTFHRFWICTHVIMMKLFSSLIFLNNPRQSSCIMFWLHDCLTDAYFIDWFGSISHLVAKFSLIINIIYWMFYFSSSVYFSSGVCFTSHIKELKSYHSSKVLSLSQWNMPASTLGRGPGQIWPAVTYLTYIPVGVTPRPQTDIEPNKSSQTVIS